MGVAICLITTWLCQLVGYSLLSLIPRTLICLVVPNILMILVFWRTKEFRYFGRLGKELLGKVRNHESD